MALCPILLPWHCVLYCYHDIVSYTVTMTLCLLSFSQFLAVCRPAPYRLDQMFSDAFSREHQLIKADPKNSLYLACALMLRGRVEVSDIRRNIDK